MGNIPNDINIYNILRSCIKSRKEDADTGFNTSACVTDLQLGKFNGTSKEDVYTEELYEVLLSRTFRQQKLNIQFCGEFLRLEYTFSSSDSSDLKIFMSALNDYAESKSLKPTEEDETWRYSMLLTLVPDEYHGKYTISLMEPLLWGLSSSKKNTPVLDRLYIVLSINNVNLNRYEP